MKNFLLLAGLSACSLFSNAQTAEKVAAIKRCSSAELYQQMLKSDASFGKNRAAIERFTDNFLKKESSERLVQPAAVQYTIPVIVHVLYNNATQNISDAQIQSQIDVLNKDYQKLNTDRNKVPSVWTSLVANCQVKFCLATIDPGGNTTTGVRRVHTTKTSFSANNNAMKFTAQGGDDAWPSTQYLNLWVCKLSGGVLGFAQFPGGNASTDGVVITHTGFGTTGTAAYPYNLGRTATHEVGHWLNLYHIWGDDGQACNGSDLVGDTPNQADEHYGCPSFPQVSCTNGPNGDMFMNYMDYTDDRCMYMFTTGQKQRMKATLVSGGSRYSITQSGKCGSGFASAPVYAQVDNAILSVSPNPTKSVASISYKLEKTASIQLVVSGLYGNNLINKNIGVQTAGKYTVTPSEIASLHNGVYTIKLIANGEMIASSRIEVQK